MPDWEGEGRIENDFVYGRSSGKQAESLKKYSIKFEKRVDKSFLRVYDSDVVSVS